MITGIDPTKFSYDEADLLGAGSAEAQYQNIFDQLVRRAAEKAMLGEIVVITSGGIALGYMTPAGWVGADDPRAWQYRKPREGDRNA